MASLDERAAKSKTGHAHVLRRLRERLAEQSDALSKRQSAVLLALLTFVGPDGEAFPSLDAIAEVARVRKDHVSQALAELEAFGLLGKRREGRKVVRIIAPIRRRRLRMKPRANQTHRGSGSEPQNGSGYQTHGGEKETHGGSPYQTHGGSQKETDKETQKETGKETGPSGSSVFSSSVGSVSVRAKALKRKLKSLAGPDGATLGKEEIDSALHRYGNDLEWLAACLVNVKRRRASLAKGPVAALRYAIKVGKRGFKLTRADREAGEEMLAKAQQRRTRSRHRVGGDGRRAPRMRHPPRPQPRFRRDGQDFVGANSGACLFASDLHEEFGELTEDELAILTDEERGELQKGQETTRRGKRKRTGRRNGAQYDPWEREE